MSEPPNESVGSRSPKADVRLRRAIPADTDYFAAIDLQVDREDGDPRVQDLTDERQYLLDRRPYFLLYTQGADQVAWVYEDAGRPVGFVMGEVLNRHGTPPYGCTDWRQVGTGWLDETLFPANGLFCSVFLLWVEPSHRRQGLGTALKRQLEIECRQRNIHMIQSVTQKLNVVELNLRLGYRIVHRGPLRPGDRQSVWMVKDL